jgi:hypothetical protein
VNILFDARLIQGKLFVGCVEEKQSGSGLWIWAELENKFGDWNVIPALNYYHYLYSECE